MAVSKLHVLNPKVINNTFNGTERIVLPGSMLLAVNSLSYKLNLLKEMVLSNNNEFNDKANALLKDIFDLNTQPSDSELEANQLALLKQWGVKQVQGAYIENLLLIKLGEFAGFTEQVHLEQERTLTLITEQFKNAFKWDPGHFFEWASYALEGFGTCKADGQKLFSYTHLYNKVAKMRYPNLVCEKKKNNGDEQNQRVRIVREAIVREAERHQISLVGIPPKSTLLNLIKLTDWLVKNGFPKNSIALIEDTLMAHLTVQDEYTTDEEENTLKQSDMSSLKKWAEQEQNNLPELCDYVLKHNKSKVVRHTVKLLATYLYSYSEGIRKLEYSKELIDHGFLAYLEREDNNEDSVLSKLLVGYTGKAQRTINDQLCKAYKAIAAAQAAAIFFAA